MADKTCPKCPNSLPMNKSSRPAFIPALLPGQTVAGPSDPKPAFPVLIYECPHCHLVELYHEE
jgi:hypothetical protein